MIHPFYDICQGGGGGVVSQPGKFLISCILVLYLKDQGEEVKIKIVITGDELKLVTMMFVDDWYFATLLNINNGKWGEVLQQN